MSEAPVLCNQCLGLSEHVRMIRQLLGEQCKLCTRPFTVFRWNLAGEHRQLKKTIICHTCAQARNCCQSCMVDVDYGIPLDIRDAALKMAGVENQYAVESLSRNAEVKAIMADKLEHKSKTTRASSSDEKREKARKILETLAAKLSGNTVPRPRQRELEISNKELTKTISKLPFGGTIETPQDASLKSFFVFGFSPNTPLYSITSFFEKFGTLGLVMIIHQTRCGFVTFAQRSAAEDCAQHLKTKGHGKNTKTAALLILDEKEPVRVCWGSPKHLGNSKEEQAKIAVVVNKVMKQLADKDMATSRGPRKNDRAKRSCEIPAPQKAAKPAATKSYKSMSEDFEL